MPTPDEIKKFNHALIAQFRAEGGEVEDWDHLLLLTTIGARSGRPHTTPLVYSIDGNHFIVIGADLGAPKHPAWYHNLVVNPEVTVELGRRRIRMHAVVAKGKQRERLFNQHAAQVPDIVEYQERTKRRLPVVILTDSQKNVGQDSL